MYRSSKSLCLDIQVDESDSLKRLNYNVNDSQNDRYFRISQIIASANFDRVFHEIYKKIAHADLTISKDQNVNSTADKIKIIPQTPTKHKVMRTPIA